MPRYKVEDQVIDLCESDGGDSDICSDSAKDEMVDSTNAPKEKESAQLFFLDRDPKEDSDEKENLTRTSSITYDEMNDGGHQIGSNDGCEVIQKERKTSELEDENQSLSSSITAKVTESDDDSADKMANFSDDVKASTDWTILQNDSSSEQGDDNVEVSFVSEVSKTTLATLSDEKRHEVNLALKRVCRECYRSRPFHRVNHIRHARVPIIQSKTAFNFECDLSIGGHNGSDTSNLAKQYNLRYSYFASITVFLKVLLRQADLDKPFTGGLGSYRLYVMIASFLEEYSSQRRASINSSEVLLGFLRQYGISRKRKILVTKHVHCSLGTADLSGVYKLPLCLQLFELAYTKLFQILKENHEKYSLLVCNWISFLYVFCSLKLTSYYFVWVVTFSIGCAH